MKLRELIRRILLLVAVCAIQAIYFPTSLRTSGGFAPKTALDIIPIWPIWVLPYLSCFPMWITAALWALWKMKTRMFNALMLACGMTFSLSIATFLLFPTYVERTPLTGEDPFTKLLLWVYQTGGDYDALPSGHIYITSLLVFFYNLWKPAHQRIWWGILGIVSLTTLFTGQHYILDLLAGFAVAWIGYLFGIRMSGFKAEKLNGERASSINASNP